MAPFEYKSDSGSSLRTQVLLRFRWPQKLGIAVLGLGAAVFGALSPVFQRLMLSPADLMSARYQALAGTIGCLAAAQTFGVLAQWRGQRESALLQEVLGHRVYQHALALRVQDRSTYTSGDLVALYATDVAGSGALLEQWLTIGTTSLLSLLAAPLLLNRLYQFPMWQVSLTLLVIVAVFLMLALRQRRFFERFKQFAADRISSQTEWIQNIKILRALGWIPAVEAMIFKKRKIETKNRLNMVVNGQTMSSLSGGVAFVLNAIGIAALLALRGHDVSGAELLSLLWVLGVFLNRPMRSVPWVFTFGFDGWTSFKRIEAFLAIPATAGSAAAPSKSETASQSVLATAIRPAVPIQTPWLLDVEGLEVEMAGRKLLNPTTLSIRPGERVAVVGPVGSGKTTLLRALLGEVPFRAKRFEVLGEDWLTLSESDRRKRASQVFSYVPQEPFLMNAKLIQNLELSYDDLTSQDAWQLPLARAQFYPEQEGLSEGLAAFVGERGVTLSGGQKQRVNLARMSGLAAREGRRIWLLDDPLSAVDAATEAKLVADLFKGQGRDQAVLLTTHRMSVLSQVDRVVELKIAEGDAR